MLPRFSVSTHYSVNHGVLARHARVTTTTAAANRNTHTARHQVLAAASRLVLTPTGNGKWDHIGDQVPLPEAIPLKDGVYEVGRSEPADIVLNIPTVSGRHALLRVEEDKICITDLNSTNGTVVDGRELTPMDDATLTVGSEVIFGDMYLAKFTVTQADHDAPSGASEATPTGAATEAAAEAAQASLSAALRQQRQQLQGMMAQQGQNNPQLGW